MSTSTAPSWAEIIRAAFANEMMSVFGGWLPGRIKTYDSAKRKASIELLIQQRDYIRSELKVTDYPVINEVPVWMPGCGGVRLKFPIKVGDDVIVMFAARSIDRWLKAGGKVDPGDDRHHDINDALAIPGLHDFAHASDAGTMIEIDDSEIKCGGSNKLVTRAEFLNHTHASAPLGPITPPTEIVATPGGPFPGTAKLRG